MLTPEEIQEALTKCPKHRHDLRDGLRLLLRYAKRGFQIKENAPAWIQAKNEIFVASIDKGVVDEESETS